MKPFAIVIHFDVLEDMLLGIVSRLEPLAVNGFDLPRVRIVVASNFQAV